MLDSALRDDLTKAFNKRYFQDRLESEYAYAIRHNLATSLISFDIDHFKAVNDTYGHPAGDRVLEELARVVLSTIRVEDVFARVGGEEFSIICRGADLLQAKIVAERIRLAVERHPVTWQERTIALTVSVGVVAVPSATVRSAMDLVAAADEMLYEAKRAGRNRVTLWNR
jgi:two-component system, cell cycle response regulator